jgi:hypothetical protein
MEKVVFSEVSETLFLKIESIGGDLRLSGREGNRFEAQAPEKGDLKVEQDGDQIALSCRSGCLIYLPRTARVETGQVGGDARVTGLSNELMIRNIGGDLSLRRVGRSTFELIGGDLQARKVVGDLTVDRVGGDAIVEKIEGDVRLRAIGGDLLLRGVSGLVQASTGGDASVELSPEGDQQSSIQVGSDLSCRLPEETSAKVIVRAGGEIAIPANIEEEESDEGTVLSLGDAEATIELSSGGDLLLRIGDLGPAYYDDDFIGPTMSEVDAKLAEVEARFGALTAGAFAFDVDRIGERVRRSVARARRKADWTRYKAGKMKHPKPPKPPKVPKFGRGFGFGDFDTEEPAVSEEERMTILRMVEDGKLSVEEAEQLLQALEGTD